MCSYIKTKNGSLLWLQQLAAKRCPMPAIVRLHQSDGQAALTRARGRTAARTRRAFVYSSRERTHFGAAAKAKWLGFGRIPTHSLCSHVCARWAVEHNNRQTWFGSQLRPKHTRRPYCGVQTATGRCFHRKHCPYRPKTLHPKKSLTRKLPKLTVVGFKYRCCETLESTDTVSIALLAGCLLLLNHLDDVQRVSWTRCHSSYHRKDKSVPRQETAQKSCNFINLCVGR